MPPHSLPPLDSPSRAHRLRELAVLFLKLGTTAFGGPAAHIAMMEDEVVRRRQWLTRTDFLDYLSASNLIPGPNSTELAIHIGFMRAGWPGLIVAGLCFILPAVVIVTFFAWGYVRFGTLPTTAGILYGVKPVVIAVVIQALWTLGRTALKTPTLIGIGILVVIAAAFNVDELILLIAAGALMFFLHHTAASNNRTFRSLLLPATDTLQHAVPGVFGATTMLPFNLLTLFGVFLKVGAVLFGSGYVLLAFLRTDLVERLGWLTEQQLLDAVAVGQVTPGPVFTTATFIGYLLDGTPGAAVATIGIFLPAFVFVAISGALLPRLRNAPAARAVLDGVNVASLALMAVVTTQLGWAALIDPFTVALALVSIVMLVRYRVNSAWLVLGGALIGLAKQGALAGYIITFLNT